MGLRVADPENYSILDRVTNVIPMFAFKSQQLRGVTIDGQPWFVAADACRALEMDMVKGTHRWLAGIDSDEKRLATRVTDPQIFCGSNERHATLISRPGLFKLIQRSNKPEAKEFDRWVRHEVLPQIMDHGGYVQPDADINAIPELTNRKTLTTQRLMKCTRPLIAFAVAVTLVGPSHAAERKVPLDRATVTLQERADAAEVKLIMSKDRAPEHPVALAEVYALSCQKGNGQTDASADDALNQLKIKAARLMANAVVGVVIETGWQPNPLFRRADIKCSDFILATGIAVHLPQEK